MVITLVLGVLRLPLSAQFDMVMVDPKPPQAQSRQELDTYLDIVQSHEPARIVSLASRFAKQFPESEFLGQDFGGFRGGLSFFNPSSHLEFELCLPTRRN